MSFEQRFLYLIFEWIKNITIITLYIIVLNSDFLIDGIIIYLLLLVCIQIILSNFL